MTDSIRGDTVKKRSDIPLASEDVRAIAGLLDDVNSSILQHDVFACDVLGGVEVLSPDDHQLLGFLVRREEHYVFSISEDGPAVQLDTNDLIEVARILESVNSDHSGLFVHGMIGRVALFSPVDGSPLGHLVSCDDWYGFAPCAHDAERQS